MDLHNTIYQKKSQLDKVIVSKRVKQFLNIRLKKPTLKNRKKLIQYFMKKVDD
jgi:hypothetical protein